MLGAGADNGSGAYVALERVTGTLHGRTGTFMMSHSGTRTPSSQHLAVTVIAGCCDGELSGLEGKMTITMVGGSHSYELEYSLPS